MASDPDDFQHGFAARKEDGECPFCPHLMSRHTSSGCTVCDCKNTDN